MSSAYIDGLKMLGAARAVRAQVRQRLAPQGTRRRTTSTTAVARLREERAIDDRARRRGDRAHARRRSAGAARLRVRLQIERAGIADGHRAGAPIDEVFGAIDDDALLEASLRKRLRGARDDRRRRASSQRLFRYLVGQGFDVRTAVMQTRSKRAFSRIE